MGSMAIALSAEYGELCPSAISFAGSSCTNPRPAAESQRASRGRSGISPMPQLAREGIENSGTRMPACRPVSNRSLDIRPLQDAPDPVSKGPGLREQADDEE